MSEPIEDLFEKTEFAAEDRKVLESFLDDLDSGRVRAAVRVEGQWQVNSWVKKGILVGFRMGVLSDQSIDESFRYFDKDTYPLKDLNLNSGVRVVPGGSSIRRGSYVGSGVTCMPPMYINTGAYVDQDSMVDSLFVLEHFFGHSTLRADDHRLSAEQSRIYESRCK